MDKIPLELGIARQLPSKAGKATKASGAGKKSGSASALPGKIPKELKEKIHARDNNTCRCCGFVAEKYQEIHFLNHDKTDLREENLATTCIFCHQCFNLQKVHEMRSGVLVWLPEIEQDVLHHIARAIYVGRISQGATADASRKALDVIMERREEVKTRLGTDRPYILSMVLSDYLNHKHYYHRTKKLDGVRLFPLDRRIIKEADLEFNQFPQILAYWRSKNGPFGGKPPAQWPAIYQELTNKAA